MTDRDENQQAADLIDRTTSTDDDTPAELEEAWQAWSKSIQGVDRRGMELLRAAFEAGWDAASHH